MNFGKSTHIMFRKILLLLQEHFNATPKEARGYSVLIALSFFVMLIPLFFRSFVIPLVYDPGVVITGTPEAAGKPDNGTLSGEREETGYEEKESVKKPVRLFRFDPNSVTTDEMETLGFPAFLARRVDHYRSKGGRFRKKEDLMKIYDFPSALYKSVEGYIVINATLPEQARKNFVSKKEGTKESVPLWKDLPVKQEKVSFDLNKADSLQLISLRGIGPVLSDRILKYRRSLGGFHSMQQLYEVYRLDSMAIGEISKNTFIREPVTKMNINQSTPAQLLRHPYLRDKKKEVNVLLNYRMHHGPFTSEADLFNSQSLDSLTIRKILPYLHFN